MVIYRGQSLANHSGGSQLGKKIAIGKSVVSHVTKVHMAVDSYGLSGSGLKLCLFINVSTKLNFIDK